MGKTNSGELLQGTLPLIVLRIRYPGANHGFAIARRIQAISKNVLRAEEGSLSPALHKMKLEGWIESEGGVTENNRRAKYDRLTSRGRKTTEAGDRTLELNRRRHFRHLAGGLKCSEDSSCAWELSSGAPKSATNCPCIWDSSQTN
jgi:PadR family transcriptional regulator